jgi:hypothetical protein
MAQQSARTFGARGQGEDLDQARAKEMIARKLEIERRTARRTQIWGWAERLVYAGICQDITALEKELRAMGFQDAPDFLNDEDLHEIRGRASRLAAA